MGKNEFDMSKNYRICECHQLKKVVKDICINYKNKVPFKKPLVLTISITSNPQSSFIKSNCSRAQR